MFGGFKQGCLFYLHQCAFDKMICSQGGIVEMQNTMPFWYVTRTKPKHEHIAAANVKRQFNLDAFLPRLRMEKLTCHGLVRLVNQLFPCCLFVNSVMENRVAEWQHVSGIRKIARFGNKIPHVSEPMIKELQFHFGADDTLVVEHHLTPGNEVTITEGVFAGLNALAFKNLPAKKRVQILLEVLGGLTPVELRQKMLLLKKTLGAVIQALARSQNLERIGVRV